MDPEIERRAATVVDQRWPGAELKQLGSLTGHSGLTLTGDLVGAGSPRRVVLKMCPPGRRPVGRHDVLRQATLLQELGARTEVRVPEVLFVDRDDPPVVIQSWVEGEAVEPVLELQPGGRPVDLLHARYRGAARMLATLHTVAPAELETASAEPGRSPSEELERWRPTMETVEPGLRTGADELFTALNAHPPVPGRPAVVHGDYRLGNILCDGQEITAVVDWEIWSVGDARVDLGWFGVMSAPDDLPGITTSRDGVLDAGAILGEYERASGAPVIEMPWFDALSRYKMAAIMGNNLQRHRKGSRVDPYQEQLVQTIPALIRRGRELAAAIG